MSELSRVIVALSMSFFCWGNAITQRPPADGTNSLVSMYPSGRHAMDETIIGDSRLGELFAPVIGSSYLNTNYTMMAMILQDFTGNSCKEYLIFSIDSF